MMNQQPTDTLLKLDEPEPCSIYDGPADEHGITVFRCGKPAHWRVNGEATCAVHIAGMAAINSDNAEFLQPTNEREKVQAVQTESEAIGGFLEWAQSHGMFLCKRVNPNPDNEYQYRVPIEQSTNELLAHYYGINLKKVDQEQKAILDQLRITHEHEEQ